MENTLMNTWNIVLTIWSLAHSKNNINITKYQISHVSHFHTKYLYCKSILMTKYYEMNTIYMESLFIIFKYLKISSIWRNFLTHCHNIVSHFLRFKMSLIELDFHRSWISWDHCIPQTEEHEAVKADIKEAVKADIKHLNELWSVAMLNAG